MSTLKSAQYESGGSSRVLRRRILLTPQPDPASTSCMKAATESLLVAASMVTRDAVGVSNSKRIAQLGNAERGVLRHIPGAAGLVSRMAARQFAHLSMWRWAFGSVRRIPGQSPRVRTAAGAKRIRPDGRTRSHACSHVSGSGVRQRTRPGQSTKIGRAHV